MGHWEVLEQAALSVNAAAYPVHLETSGRRASPFTDHQRLAISTISVLLALLQCAAFLVRPQICCAATE
eukprot:4720678-Amphidinium_carterae.1